MFTIPKDPVLNLACRQRVLEDRFWQKIDHNGPLPKDASLGNCWTWTGSRNACGYGTFAVNSQNRLAHRVCWELCNGEIPEGMCVCHRRDTPGCCRITHLFLGTPADNVQDRDRKKRRTPLCGIGHPRAKLSDEDVLEIRRRYAAGNVFQYELAKEFGVTQPMVGFIVRRESWKHLS